jgi:hypothetical protein
MIVVLKYKSTRLLSGSQGVIRFDSDLSCSSDHSLLMERERSHVIAVWALPPPVCLCFSSSVVAFAVRVRVWPRLHGMNSARSDTRSTVVFATRITCSGNAPSSCTGSKLYSGRASWSVTCPVSIWE